MTAKEEAKKLYEMYFYAIPSFTDEGQLEHETSKKCALIDIENTINALETYDERTEEYLKEEFPNYLSCELQNMEQDLRFYEQVKKEIELL
jgi:hypothetical protein